MQPYIEMFAECGVEVYETMGTVWVEESSGRNARRIIRYGKFEQVLRSIAAMHGI